MRLDDFNVSSIKTANVRIKREKTAFVLCSPTPYIKRACEIRKFHVAGVQRRQRNVQHRIMQVPICCFVNENVLLVRRLLQSPSSLVLLSSRNSATMVT